MSYRVVKASSSSSKVITLAANVTWYVSPTGDANADGLTVGTPITLEEAASRVFQVVPTQSNLMITLDLASGSYTYANNYTFVHPDTQFDFDITLQGQQWVGIYSYPTTHIPYCDITFKNFKSYSYVKNIHYFTLTVIDSQLQVEDVACMFYINIFGQNNYTYLTGLYKLSEEYAFAFNVVDGYLDLGPVTFDAGETTRNYSDAFIRLRFHAKLDLASPVTVVGTFTGNKLSISPGAILDDTDEAYLTSLPGDVAPVYPAYIFTPSNTLATTDSLGTAAVLDVNVAGGVCTLDGGGKVSSAYLPSYVDDVLELANLASFPVTGEIGKIYIALDSNRTYRWGGSVYVEVSNPFSGSYADLSNKPTLGTAAALDAGTGANNLVQLDNDNKLPAVDGSQLIGVNGGHTVQDEGVSLTQRTKLNFTGSAVSAADNALDDSTDIVIDLPATGAGLDLGTWDDSSNFTTGVAFDGEDSKFIIPKATTAQRMAATPLKRELLYDTDLDRPFYGDGITVGGKTLLAEVLTLTPTKTANYTASNKEEIPCNTTAGAFTITTPAAGEFAVFDVGGITPATGFALNNLTITPASGTIMGDTSYVLDVGAVRRRFVLVGSDWRVA